jgi:hypothetical protein
MRKIYLLLGFILTCNYLFAQTPVPMSSQPGLTYTENFADIANWANSFASGIGANRFASVAVNATGTIPDGIRVTTASANFVTGTSGGVQRGSAQTPATQSIVLLSTGSTDNSSSVAIDFFMDFTGVNAGTLSFDWASINNSTGDRRGSLRVYASTDGASFAELSGAQVLNFINNTPSSGSITTVALPASFNNSATARLRFYFHNGSGGTTGSRPKMSIDNLTVTATPGGGGNTVSVSSGTNAVEPSATGTLTINFSAPTSASTDINFDYTGTAGFGTDYAVSYSAGTTASTTSTGTLNVPAGVSVITVTITPVDDPDIEALETISLTLSSPTGGYTVGTSNASINLISDDVAPSVSVAAGVNATEPATSGTFVITLSSTAPLSGVTVNYTLTGTATLNADYTDPQSGSITITAGNTSGTVTVNVTDDPDAEPAETIILTIDNVTAPYTINTASATINVTSDDFTPISLTGVYTQDFNTLANTGLNNGLTIPGWLLNETGNGARDNEQYATDNGGSNTGDTYSYGAASSTERSLGSLQSGTLISSFGSGYINNTGATINKLRVTYTGEQWRLGATGRNDRIDFQYSTDAINIVTGTWIDINQLDFTAPNGITGTIGSLVGNDPGNRITVTFDINGLSIPNGSSFFLRWNDANASGADDGLAIDDLSVEPNPLDLVPPVIFSLSPANGAGNVSLNTTATLAFDEPVQKLTGNITIRRTSDNSVVQTIDVNSATVTVSSASVSFALPVLSSNSGYYIEVDNGAFEDLSGNDFSGISGSATWSFTTGINFYTADFNSCTSSLTDGFTQFSIAGPIVWGCTTFGRDPSAPAGSTPFPNGLQINGFSGGTNVPNIDWLISPAFNLTGTTYPLLTYWSRTAFNGPPLQLKVSTDYTGGDPTLATWTDLNGKFPALASNVWTISSDINLSAFKQPNVHFAFVYTSSDDDGARWTLDDVSVVNSPTAPPPSLTVSTTDLQFTYVANGGTVDKTFTFIGNDLIADVTLSSTGDFLLSRDGNSYSTSIIYTQAEANDIAETVYVRFAPTQANQNFAGIVTVNTSTLSATINLKGTSIDPATTLEVVNWNMEWFGSTDPTLGPNNDPLQEQNARTIMQTIGADLYALVEVVDEARLASIVSQMPGYAYVICDFGSHTNPNAPNPGPLSAAQKEAYVYKTSVFSNVSTAPLLSQGINSIADMTNPAYNWWSSGRFPFMMKADVTLNCVTKTVRFVAVHAKANTSPTATSYARRKAGADTLYYTLNTLYPNDNIVILGDFNDDLDQSITAGFTTTSWDAFTTDATNYASLTLPLSLAGKKSTVTYNDVIDHVVVSNEMAPYYMPGTATILNDVTSLVNNYGNTTSDHYPVFTRYQFEAPPAPAIACPEDIVKTTDAGSCGAVATYTMNYSGNCGTATVQQTTGLPSGSVFPIGTTTNTFIITDAAGGSATCSFSVTVTDNENPTITCPAAITTTTAPGTCGAVVTYNVAFADNCTGATIQQTAGIASGAVFPTGTTTNTFVVTDASGNTATCSFTVTVNDSQAPAFTRPADITIPFTGACSYNAAITATGDVTNEQDNCSTGLQAIYTDEVTSCGNNVTITRTWKLSDNTGNAAPDQIQTITVSDNTTSYVVYATKEAKFDEYNFVNGSVGVTSATGKAEFKRGSVVPSPFFARAKTVTVNSQAFVPNRILTAANDGPTPPFFAFSGTTSGLPTRTINASTAVPVSANYRELKIKKNVSVTITGTLYGRIDIEAGAEVTFAPAGGVVNIESLKTDGDLFNITRIKFSECSAVRVKDKVEIIEFTELNNNGPKVTFYLGDNNVDEEQFLVSGSANLITANIYIPKGELRVKADVNFLNGWFIAEKLYSEGKFVVWNDNNCATSDEAAENFAKTKETIGQPVQPGSNLKVTASPNPTTDQFMLRIESSSEAPVSVRIMDVSGKTLSLRSNLSSNSTVRTGSELINGVYFAEVMQGNEKRVIKLIKLK